MPSDIEKHLTAQLAKAKSAGFAQAEIRALEDANAGVLKDIQDSLANLVEKVRNVYYAACWTADRPVDEAKLWTDLRDAAGFEPGNSPKPIEPEPTKPVAPVEKKKKVVADPESPSESV